MTVKFSFGNSGDENNNCYKYYIDEDNETIETMIERIQSVKGVETVEVAHAERVKIIRLHFLKEASRKVTGLPNQKNPVERLKVVRVEPVKVGVHNQKRVEPVEPVDPVECDEEYQLVQQTQRLNLTTTP